MTYIQNLGGCGKDIQNTREWTHLVQKNVLMSFQEAYHKGHFPQLLQATQEEDIKYLESIARGFEAFENILILGTGGSSLGGRAIDVLQKRKTPRLHFIDNIDPSIFEKVFETIHPKTTGVLVISKSGSTIETIFQLLICLQHFKKTNAQDHFMVITEPTSNPLRKIAQEEGWLCVDHPLNVGGRYSCFSVVGLLPLILAGLNPYAFREGGCEVLDHHLHQDMPPAFEGALMTVYLHLYAQKNLSVMFPYSEKLSLFSLWYRQLWAESLGKKGMGLTPIDALGTVDQHSQLQLYLDGPKDKFFTILAPAWKGKGEKIESSFFLEYKGKTLGDLFAAEQQATYGTLVNHQCPTRLITFEHIDEKLLGALMMHFMIETVLTASLINVNAFDQPAVEEGKRLAKEFLSL